MAIIRLTTLRFRSRVPVVWQFTVWQIIYIIGTFLDQSSGSANNFHGMFPCISRESLCSYSRQWKYSCFLEGETGGSMGNKACYKPVQIHAAARSGRSCPEMSKAFRLSTRGTNDQLTLGSVAKSEIVIVSGFLKRSS